MKFITNNSSRSTLHIGYKIKVYRTDGEYKISGFRTW